MGREMWLIDEIHVEIKTEKEDKTEETQREIQK
jgi:hypothetical protein